MNKVNFEVRDSELDAQGIVNNANYFIYMAHARHKYIAEIGIDFVEMAKNNQNLLLISSNIEYKRPLVSRDLFYVLSEVLIDGKIKFAFKQEIYKEDGTLIAKAYNLCVCMDENRKRPYLPELIIKHLNKPV
jgi:acyl-CoA thioester hydrolase